MRDDTIALIAVLKAKAGQTEALRDALQALLLPTREEPGNLDYALFQLRDAPDTFYMRESGATSRRWMSISPSPTSVPLSARWRACSPSRCGWII